MRVRRVSYQEKQTLHITTEILSVEVIRAGSNIMYILVLLSTLQNEMACVGYHQKCLEPPADKQEISNP